MTILGGQKSKNFDFFCWSQMGFYMVWWWSGVFLNGFWTFLARFDAPGASIEAVGSPGASVEAVGAPGASIESVGAPGTSIEAVARLGPPLRP